MITQIVPSYRCKAFQRQVADAPQPLGDGAPWGILAKESGKVSQECRIFKYAQNGFEM
jgi:hypothetical protein